MPDTQTKPPCRSCGGTGEKPMTAEQRQERVFRNRAAQDAHIATLPGPPKASPLARMSQTFRLDLATRERANRRVEESAAELHNAIIAAHDQGLSIEQIADDLGVTEDAADHWVGALVRGRNRFEGNDLIPSPAYNADRWLNGTEQAA